MAAEPWSWDDDRADSADEDEREAEQARARYRVDGLAQMAADDAVASHLQPGEGLLAQRSAVSWLRDGHDTAEEPVDGPLYLTTQRLLVLAGVPRTVNLSLIEEVALAGERLLVSLRDGTGLDLRTTGPRLLRVQIAAALMGVRG